MEAIRTAVLKCIYDHAENDDRLIDGLNGLAGRFGSHAFGVMLHVLTHLDIEPARAQACWMKILAHRTELSRVLQRPIRLRTAICDYFCSIDKTLKNPIVIEIHIFEATANSSKYDSLTGLFSRGFFDSALEREVARARRYRTKLSILFFDLDDFKRINDAHGHMVGDTVLKAVSRVILEGTRSEDTAARFGGEEIVVVLPETAKAQALVFGERIRRKVKALVVEHDGVPIRVTLSGGLATYPMDADTPEKLIRCADDALYSAKKAGKDNIAFFSQDKRQYSRIDYSAKIKVRQLGFNGQKDVTGISKNISITGIRFESTAPMEIGSRVQLHIPVVGSEAPILMIGTVVRAEVRAEDRYDISVSFLDVENIRLEDFGRMFPGG